MRQRIKSARRSDDISMANSFVLVEDDRTGRQFRIPCDKLLNNGGGKRVYRALLTQVGTGAPSVGGGNPGEVGFPLENTIGAIVWTRSDVGIYSGTLANAFPIGRTFTYISPHSFNPHPSNQLFARQRVMHPDAAPNAVNVYTLQGTAIGAAPTSHDFIDGILINTPILIEVYD